MAAGATTLGAPLAEVMIVDGRDPIQQAMLNGSGFGNSDGLMTSMPQTGDQAFAAGLPPTPPPPQAIAGDPYSGMQVPQTWHPQDDPMIQAMTKQFYQNQLDSAIAKPSAWERGQEKGNQLFTSFLGPLMAVGFGGQAGAGVGQAVKNIKDDMHQAKVDRQNKIDNAMSSLKGINSLMENSNRDHLDEFAQHLGLTNARAKAQQDAIKNQQDALEAKNQATYQQGLLEHYKGEAKNQAEARRLQEQHRQDEQKHQGAGDLLARDKFDWEKNPNNLKHQEAMARAQAQKDIASGHDEAGLKKIDKAAEDRKKLQDSEDMAKLARLKTREDEIAKREKEYQAWKSSQAKKTGLQGILSTLDAPTTAAPQQASPLQHLTMEQLLKLQAQHRQAAAGVQ